MSEFQKFIFEWKNYIILYVNNFYYFERLILI